VDKPVAGDVAKPEPEPPVTEAAPEAPIAPAAPAPAAPPASKPKANPVRNVALIAVLVALGLFTYGVIADRLTPYTDQATVQAFVVRPAPDVSGRVLVVNVIDNQPARAGQVLYAIDPERYEIAVRTAEAQLASAGQSVGASTANLAATEANLAQAEAALANARAQSARTFSMVSRGVSPLASGDQARAELRTAVAVVTQAKASVEQARQALGPIGEANPQIRQAQAALRKARRDLADTVVRAPSDGVVTNLQLAAGQFVGAGQSVLTFIDRDVIWIDSELPENSLEHIKVGDEVGIVLDVRPGRVYPGRVESVGWGVDTRDIDSQTGLPSIKNDSGWIREPQRFVVRVRFEPEKRPTGIRLGSQASVVVYTKSSVITDTIGRLWIVVVAYLSYLN
jgi:multidrug resistance efflux pump